MKKSMIIGGAAFLLVISGFATVSRMEWFHSEKNEIKPIIVMPDSTPSEGELMEFANEDGTVSRIRVSMINQ